MNIFTSLKKDIKAAFEKIYNADAVHSHPELGSGSKQQETLNQVQGDGSEMQSEHGSTPYSHSDDKPHLDNIGLEIPKDPLNGDLSSNIAMVLASKLSQNPRQIALKFKEYLSKVPYIAHIEIAGPGFINFTIKASFWQNCIKDILEDKNYFYQTKIPKNQKINLEYVSANPTGPMHIGHARGAVYGDVLANILDRCGYEVTREYYINDAGAQIDTLAQTVFLRYKEAITKNPIEIPAGLYPGDYLIPVGEKLAKIHGDKLIKLEENERINIIKSFAVPEMLELIKNDLNDLGVHHNIFKSEKELYDKGAIEVAIKKLEEKGKIYIGTLPAPKGKINEDWTDREQLLFKASDFGDDHDRPLKKADGEWTYLAADIAYTDDKIARGFNKLIYVLGADHAGYVKRIEAFVKALSDNKVLAEVKICRLVNFIKDGKPFKMSKRAGNFATVRDILDLVGKDIVRFMMIARKNDTVIEFDLAKVREQTKENPVFYVQYGHVRTISILNNAKEKLPLSYDLFKDRKYDLSHLTSEKELELIKLLSSFTNIIETCAYTAEPHRLILYLEDIATKFHALWNLGKDNADYRFIIENNIELTAARLGLVKAVELTVAEGLNIIGITALRKM